MDDFEAELANFIAGMLSRPETAMIEAPMRLGGRADVYETIFHLLTGPMGVSKATVAAHLQVSPGRVSQYIDEGFPASTARRFGLLSLLYQTTVNWKMLARFGEGTESMRPDRRVAISIIRSLAEGGEALFEIAKAGADDDLLEALSKISAFKAEDSAA